MKKTVIIFIASLMLASLFSLNAFADGAQNPPVAISLDPSQTTALPSSDALGSQPTAPTGEISGALSPAIDIIAANSPMAKAGLAGDAIEFSEDDFARAMNLSKINTLTFVSVPSSSEGVLLLGNIAVTAGQSISRANLELLSFDPISDEPCSASFEISVNGSEYSVLCSLYLLDSPNANPSVATAAQTMLNMSGYADTAIFGKLGAYDPEGDALTFEIVDAPEHGLVIMNDRSKGIYTYLPENKYVGRDKFTYVVHDKYGNYSSSATVNVTVSEPSTSVVYADMLGNEAHCAAISMTENGIMGGTQVGKLCYFYPDSEVSRVDFLVMAMNAAGIKELPTASTTGFYDDSLISDSAKPYVFAAKQLGYISGVTDADGKLCFAPDEKITRAEAALTLDKIMNAKSYIKQDQSVTPVFKDASDIPDWAKSSLSTLAALGIMTDDSGKINANDPITKGQTAMMLASMMQVVDK